MVAQAIKLTLLNHLFYYTEVSGGGTSASVTGNFLGDLALTYALKRAIGNGTRHVRHLKKPAYDEVRDFGFYCTVARPLGPVMKTEAYIQNTLFNTDGYVDVKAIEKSGKSPFKNFRQAQGIRTESQFVAMVLSEQPLVLPPVIRLGRALETMALVTPYKPGKQATDEYWLNAFSLKTVFGNLDNAVEAMTAAGKVNFSFILEQYNLIKKLTEGEVKAIFESVFSATESN